jgi:hypothetical protein
MSEADLLEFIEDDLDAFGDEASLETARPCPPPPPPSPGRFAQSPLARRLSCRRGLWYVPTYGDFLSRVAQDVIRANPVRPISVNEYMRILSAHASNLMFVSSTSGLATRAFLPLWSRTDRRTYVGRPSGGYGMLFFPTFFNRRLVSPYP